jgi:uncharacterized protein YqeY
MEVKIKEDLKQAQLLRNENSISTLRLLISEINNLKIQKGEDTLSDNDVVSVIQKELKKRREASSEFRKGNREELAQKEEAEAAVLEQYLPDQLSDEELTKFVEDSINEVGAKELKDMGRVIGVVMSKTAGKADGSRISALVKEKLTS